MARREWLADEGACQVAALATCLGFAPDNLQRPLFLDTETTGLSGGTGTVAFLIGLAWREGGGLRLVQFFLSDFNQEDALLWAVGQYVQQAGVLGSRMTGAGFGGCTVNLIRNESVNLFVRQVEERYQRETGIAAEIYVCHTSDGAGIVGPQELES